MAKLSQTDTQPAAEAERKFFAQDFYEEARTGKVEWPASQSPNDGDTRHDVECVLRQAASLAEQINYSIDHDQAVALSAELRRLLKKALSVRVTDPDVIHAIHTGTEWEAELRMSDLRALARQPAACVCPHQDANEPADNHGSECPAKPVVVDGALVAAMQFLLTRIGSWTNARWDQHLRYEFGDERAAQMIASLEALAQQPAAVDGSMVRHGLCDCPNGRAEHAVWCAAQPGGSDNDR